jgi:hypothetical protein
VPAYQVLQNRKATHNRMLEILLNGVSTRNYQQVIPEMAETVGVSKSSVSRETIEASEALRPSVSTPTAPITPSISALSTSETVEYQAGDAGDSREILVEGKNANAMF